MSSCHHVIVSSCHHFIVFVVIASCHVANSCKPMATFDKVWPCLAIIGNFYQLLPTFSNVCQFLSIFGNICQLLSICANVCQWLETFCNFWQLIVIFGYLFWQLLIPVGNIWQLSTTFSKVWQRLPTFGDFCHPVVLTSCHSVILSSPHIVLSTSCYSVLLSSCQFGSLSICQLVNLLACELLSLWTFQFAHLGTCELVLHIRSMISFGGFLAECLPYFREPKKMYTVGIKKGISGNKSDAWIIPYDTWDWPSVGWSCLQHLFHSMISHHPDANHVHRPTIVQSNLVGNLIIGMSTAEVSRGISSMALLWPWPTYLLS